MTDPRMTPTNDAPVTVEQCDRVFAAKWGLCADDDPNILSGLYDDWPFLKATARHRLARPRAAPFDMEKLRSFADRVMDAAHGCCTDPDAGPEDQTSVAFTGEEGAQIANDLHRLLSDPRPRAAVGEREEREFYDTFVEFEGWLREYRDTMQPDVMKSWAVDILKTGKAILAMRDRILDLQAPPAKVEG